MGNEEDTAGTARSQPGEVVVLKVAAGTPANQVASALVRYLEERADVCMQAIGAGAVNQMMKAMAVARGMSAAAGVDILFAVGFRDEICGGERKTAIRVYPRQQ